jgi:hypothetical protein
MRDAQAFQIELRIKHDTIPEIGLKQHTVFRFENVEGQGVAAFFDRMNDLLELGEHRLAEQGAANVVDLAVDDVGAHFSVFGLLEKMMRQQLLVEGGGDFGQEDRVIVILVGLRPLREPGVHRVPRLVRERVDVRKDVAFVIHQDVGRGAETSRRKSAAPLPFCLVTIAPAAAQTFAQGRDVFRPEGREGREDGFNRLIEGDV